MLILYMDTFDEGYAQMDGTTQLLANNATVECGAIKYKVPKKYRVPI